MVLVLSALTGAAFGTGLRRPSVCYRCGAPAFGGSDPPTQFRKESRAGCRGCPGLRASSPAFCNRPYHVDYVNTRKDKHRGKHRPILNDDLGGDLAGASRLDR
jgi:hypothetical protein